MRTSLASIQKVCMLYLVAWLIAPPLSYDTIYRVGAVIVTIIWTLCHFSKRSITNAYITRKKHYYILGSLIYCAVHIACRCVFDNMSLSAAFYGDIGTVILLVVGYMGASYVEERRSYELVSVLRFAVLLAVVFSITSILRPPQYEGITRNAGSNMNEAVYALVREGARHGVGSFGFFCFTSVLAPVVLWYAKASQKYEKLLMYFCFVIIELGVFSAGYTIALLVSFCGIGICVFATARSNMMKFTIIFSLVMTVLFWNVIEEVLYRTLISLTAGTAYQVKVADIFSFLLDGNSMGTFRDREERYMWSFYSMFRYPLFGSYLLAGIRSAGNHSSVLDSFAVYGWGIGAIWVYITMRFPSILAQNATKVMRFFFFIMLFLTGLFNQYVMTMGAFYLVFPAVAQVIGNTQGSEYSISDGY